jgi:quinol-cytochrome oxidoreductase complex cytochrome b subunit
VWRSIIRFAYPANDKARAQIINGLFVTHIHPVKVDARSIRLTYTWGLGLVSFFLFVVLFVTGVLLMFFYVPFTERAYQDILGLETTVRFGRVLRTMHRWAAHLMVAAVFLHMLRVFYTRAYRSPREFNWVIGVMLFVTTLLLSFTGYLLPWDQLSFWAVTASTNILPYAPLLGDKLRGLVLGASDVGQPALLRFYVLHVMVLPGVATVLIAFHFWRIRKDGGLAVSQAAKVSNAPRATALARPANPARNGDESASDVAPASRTERAPARRTTVLTWPNLIMLEALAGLVVVAVVLIFSMLVSAPLRDPANPDVTENPSKAPWFLVNIQELFPHMGVFLGGIIVPTVVVLAIMAVPYLDRVRSGTGEWFLWDRRERWLALWAGAYTLAWTVGLVFLDDFYPIRTWTPQQEFLSQTLIPTGIMLGVAVLLYLTLWPWRPRGRELLTVYFTAFVVAYVTMTVIGSFFRGPGFALVAPWDMGPSGLSF